MVIPRRDAKCATAFCISLLLVKIIEKWFLVAIIKIPAKIPINRDSITVTITEYFADLGCPDPSSFDTLMLKQTHEKRPTKMMSNHYSRNNEREKIIKQLLRRSTLYFSFIRMLLS